MKKFFALVLALVMALSLTTVAWGAASNAPTPDGTGLVKLTGDLELIGGYWEVTGTVTLDLNGHTLSRDSSGGTIVYVNNGGNLTVIDSSTAGTGTISGVNAFYVGVNSTATLKSGKIVGSEVAVTLFGDNGTFNMEGGSISGGSGGIVGNGNDSGTEINISGGDITGTIYHPQDGTLNISGGTISGNTAIYVKSGTVNISGGTIKGTGAAKDYQYSGSSAKTTGDALVIDNCNYPGGAPVVSITGGNFSSVNAAPVASYAGAPSGSTPPAVVDEFIEGGTFEGTVPTALLAPGLTLTTTGVVVSSSTLNEFDTKDAKTLAVKGTKALTLIPAKGAYIETATGNWVGGWVKHYVDEYGDPYVPCTADVEGALIVYYKGTTSVYDTVVAADPFYDAVAAEFTSFGTACGQLDNRADTTAKYYTYADGNGVVYLNKGTTATAKQVMVNGKLVGVEAANLIGNLNAHKWVVEKNAKNEITKATCSLCGQQASWTLNLASVPTGATFVPAPGGGFLYWNAAPVVDTETKVESAETFDAGIAMYVGMSVMAAAGSAVVLKKRED